MLYSQFFSSILGGHDLTRALQYSPFQNPGGGYHELVKERTDGKMEFEQKSLCLILDCKGIDLAWGQLPSWRKGEVLEN